MDSLHRPEHYALKTGCRESVAGREGAIALDARPATTTRAIVPIRATTKTSIMTGKAIFSHVLVSSVNDTVSGPFAIRGMIGAGDEDNTIHACK